MYAFRQNILGRAAIIQCGNCAMHKNAMWGGMPVAKGGREEERSIINNTGSLILKCTIDQRQNLCRGITIFNIFFNIKINQLWNSA